MKKIIAIFLIFFSVTCLFAQKEGMGLIDSLKSKLETSAEDTGKVRILGKLSFQYFRFDTDLGISYAEQAITLAEKLQWNLGLAFSYNYLGTNYAVKGNYPKAIEYFSKSLSKYIEIGDKQGSAYLLNNLGHFYYIQKEYSKAIESIDKAKSINQELNNNLELIKNYINIGNVYGAIFNFTKSDEYYYQALSLARKFNDIENVAKILSNIAENRASVKDYCGAIELSIEALKISEELDVPYDKAAYSSYVGSIYLTLFNDSTNLAYKCQYYSNDKVNYLYSAKKYLSNTLDLLVKIDDLLLISQTSNLLSQVYEKLGDTKNALLFYKKYSESKDSVFSKDNGLIIAKIEKEREVELKNKQIKIQALQIDKKNFQIVLIILVLLLASLILFVLYKKQQIKKESESELERRKAAIAILESEEKFRNAFHFSAIGMALISPRGKWLKVNSKVCNILGYSENELLDSTFQDITYPEDLKSDLNFNEQMLSGEIETYTIEKRLSHKTGKQVWVLVSVSLVKDSENHPLYFIFQIQDITERKRSEKEIALLANALKSVSEIVSITDLENKLLFANESFSNTYGYNTDELIGKNIMDVCFPTSIAVSISDILPATLNGGWKGELLNKRKDGTEFPIFLSTTVIHDVNNNPIALIGVALDISENKHQEKELIEAKEVAEQANKLKDAFIAGISHEIRTPLNGILGMTSIIKEIYSPYISGKEEKYFLAVDKSCQRIIRTVDMILNYSRLHVGAFPVKQDEIDIDLILISLVKEFEPIASKQSLEFSYKNRAAESIILADQYSITQAISNIIDNAIKYTDVGSVNIELYDGEKDELFLSVKDSGIGISDQYLTRIFEPYSQEHVGYGRGYEGVGLGLAIGKRILELNNSHISVDSKKGRGTSFLIKFKKVIKFEETIPSAPENFAENLNLKSGGEKWVLIVEDDQVNQEMVRAFVERDYKVIVTKSSEEVINILENNKIDIILMDISIKGSQNGLEVTKKLKSMKEFAHIPIIAETAHASDLDRRNSFDAGCNDYLSKPFRRKDLLVKMAALLNKL